MFANNKTISIKIKSIFGEGSIETICWLQLHFEHFINHHIKNDLGTGLFEIYDGDDYAVL